MIKRIFVEKKSGNDIESKGLLQDLRTNLAIGKLESVRILVRYDCENLTDGEFEYAKNVIFSEPPIDILYEEEFPEVPNSRHFSVEYLSGQYDQRADFAQQALRLINHESKARVATGKVLIFTGDISDAELEKIKNYYINPVESRETDDKTPSTLTQAFPEPEDVPVIEGFGPENIAELGLAMDKNDAQIIADYFKSEGRAPTLTEIRVLDTYWSDHCRHTTFLTTLENVDIEPEYMADVYSDYLANRPVDKSVCLMDIATAAAKRLSAEGKLAELDASEEINACSIEADVDVRGSTEKWLIMFKNETHNHPTEIEPFGGAATCLGGAIRDPLSGRAYVYQAMRITGSGDPRTEISKTLPGKLPQRKITTTAANGYSSYGNQIGLATGQVAEIYDEGYVAKRMELGAVIAAAPKRNIIRQKPRAGDVVILLGGRTGRDGCGGATGSSKAHDGKSLTTCGAEVQKGNAPQERAISRLFRNPEATALIKRCNDFGAGGVCVAVGELADGLVINLDRIPKKYEGLNGTELAISESQERMAVVTNAKDAEKFILLADSENLEATIIAEVVAEPRLIMYWRGKKIVDMSREFLDSNGAERFASAEIKTPDVSSFFSSTDDSVTSKRVLERLADTSMCSQKGLVQQFDSSIGAAACLMPFGGQTQLTPADCMAAKIPLVSGETSTCTFMSYAYNPKLAKLSPFHSAMYAVLESVAKIVAGGGDYKKIYFTFQEYFEKLGSDPSRWGKPLAALLGAYYAQIQLDRASIGGKDSMSGSFNDIDVPPALVSFAVSVGNSKNVISPEFKRAGHDLILIEIDRDSNYIPDFQQARISYEQIHKLIKDERVCSARSIGANGLIGSIIQSFGNNIGLEIATGFDLYTPRIGSILLEVASARSISFDKNVHYEVIGRTISDDKFVCDNCEVPIDESVKAWSFTLSDVFPEGDANACKPIFYKNTEKRLHYPKHITKPNVVIPVFPGTNGEYDSARAFEKAGAKVNIVVMRNLTKEHIEASIDELSEFINRSQILMIPGGFSAGDEPDGSAKYISAALRNPHISEAIMNLISKRDGLILGICNGFQALIKLGLVPYGEIRVMTPESPTLTYNISGKHISIMVKTRISSNISPWLADFNVGNEHIIPISHGEGRLVAPESVLEKLAANGQIATQYVENVNGSALSIEGITSPDGRIFGKMGHSERIISADTAKNIYGNKIQDIFKNGVAYFK